MTLDELEDAERVVFAALVGLMVRADGELSSDEAEAMAKLATEVGSGAFWLAMARARQELPDRDDVLAAAAKIAEPAKREWIYGVLVGLSAVDGMHVAESALLDELLSRWE